jgi:hypothetical protein
MKSQSIWVRIAALVGALAILLICFAGFVRPWFLNWGATEQERQARLPGDEIVPGAGSQQTRAVTIQASASQVWPWLAQTGQDRGGFYSFDLLENMVGCEMPTTDVLRPEKQAWKPGDKLWMYPADRAGGIGFATLRTVVPGRALGFGTHMFFTPPGAPEDGSWSFTLEPLTPTSSRLLIRGRGTANRPLPALAFDRLFFEPVHFMMERRMMLGVKQLAEGSDRGRLWNHIQVAFFVTAFALMAASAILVLRSRRWQRPLAGVLASGTVFQILTLGQPPLLLGFVLLPALGALLFWPGEPSVCHRARSILRARVTCTRERF